MGISFRIDANVQGAVKAMSDVNKGVTKLSGSFKESTREAKELERAARRIVRETEGPQERYNRQLIKTAQLYMQNRISKQEMIRAQAHYNRKLAELEPVQQRTFGSPAQQNLRAFAAEVLGISAVVSTLTQAFQKFREERESAAEQMKGAAGPTGTLAQLITASQDPDATRKQLHQWRNRIFRSGAVSRLEEASRLTFRLSSAQMTDEDVKALTNLQAWRVIGDAGTAAESISALRGGFAKSRFGGTMGSAEQIFSRALAASRIAPAQTQEILKAAGGAGALAGEAGVSPEALLASTAIVSKTIGVSRAESHMRQLMKSFAEYGARNREFAALNFQDKLRYIEAMGLDVLGIQEVLGGRQEALTAYTQLTGRMGLLQQLTAEVRTAPGRNLAQQTILENQRNLEVSTEVKNRQAINRQEWNNRIAGMRGTQAETIRIEREENIRKQQPGMLGTGNIWLERGIDIMYENFTPAESRLEYQQSGGLTGQMGANMNSAQLNEQTEVLLDIKDGITTGTSVAE